MWLVGGYIHTILPIPLSQGHSHIYPIHSVHWEATILYPYPPTDPRTLGILHIYSICPMHWEGIYNPTVLPILLSHGHLGCFTVIPYVPCTRRLQFFFPSHPSIQKHLGYHTFIPSVPCTERIQSYCPSHPTVPWSLELSHSSCTGRI